MLRSEGKLVTGVDLLVQSSVPLGAGLSSSAALETAVAMALCTVSGITLSPLEVVKACQKAEHEYAGMRCGIMDQFVATFARNRHALLLDCRTLQYELLPIGDDMRIVICNSMVKHELASSEYNRRRADCEAGVQILRCELPHVHALRDADVAELEKYAHKMSEVVFRRCRHVVTENVRVLAAAAALKRHDLVCFGQLMHESHASLRSDYDVSCRELDLLTELASECDGVYGARMTGGGFGGCTVNLVRVDAVDRLRERVVVGYQKQMGKVPDIYVCSPADGARPLGNKAN